jgi:16S rRNA A1518/A1519 N6-dimethyltransferase RsmA/KsgA/DIM1 with predicted DNA glycosylase/AP lyase activity
MPIELDPEGRELRALLELLPNLHCARVVEVGCGDGRLTRRYADHAASVLAFDPDEAAIVAFRSDRLPDRVEVRNDAIDRINIPRSSADVVLLSWAL